LCGFAPVRRSVYNEPLAAFAMKLACNRSFS
jgi:hypothetical protein